MCFSVQADFVAAAVLAPIAVATLRAAPVRRDLPLAALPAVFALHQFIEGFVWLGVDGRVSASVEHAAVMAYLFIAQVFLPAFVPIAVMLCEPDPRRRRAMIVPLIAGIFTAVWLGGHLATHPVWAYPADHAMVYETDTNAGVFVIATYLLATCGSVLLSTRRFLFAFGVANIVGVAIASVVRYETVLSVWCVYAAFASVLLLVQMREERRVLRLLAPPRDEPLLA